MKPSLYKTLYGLRDKNTGNLFLSYGASSQRHKALFSSKDKAQEAIDNWLSDMDIEIVEIV